MPDHAGNAARDATPGRSDAPAASRSAVPGRAVATSTGLPGALLERMQRAYGADFSAVRVHANSNEAQAAGVAAFARGDELHFSPGRYDPGSTTGQELIGHELAHVIHQRRGGRVTDPEDDDEHDPLEHEADHAAARAVRGEAVEIAGGAAIGAQFKPYKPGERIEFTWEGRKLSGLVIRLKKSTGMFKAKVYEVEVNIDGVNHSVLVSKKKLIEFEGAPEQDVALDVEALREQCHPITKEDEVDGAAVGDLLIAKFGIVIHKPEGILKKGDQRRNFVDGVLRDLSIISRTRSGQGLLASLAQAHAEFGTFAVVAYVDGRWSRANAGQIGPGGKWSPSTNEPTTSASSNVGYNPSCPGMPLSRGFDDDYKLKIGQLSSDELVMEPMLEGWGRAKNKPTDVTLFHELVHADDYLHGRFDERTVPRGQSQDVKLSELHAVGLDEYFDRDFIGGSTDKVSTYSENSYRHERGVELREWYEGPDELAPAEEKGESLGEERQLSRRALHDEIARSNHEAYEPPKPSEKSKTSSTKSTGEKKELEREKKESRREHKPKREQKIKEVKEPKRKPEKKLPTMLPQDLSSDEDLEEREDRGERTRKSKSISSPKSTSSPKLIPKPKVEQPEEQQRVGTIATLTVSRDGVVKLANEHVKTEGVQELMNEYRERAYSRLFEAKLVLKLEFKDPSVATELFEALEQLV